MSEYRPCIQINQPTRCITLSDLLPCRLNTAQHVSGILMPIIRSLSTAVAVPGLPLERGGSSVVGRGRSGCGPDRPGCPKHVELYLNDRQ